MTERKYSKMIKAWADNNELVVFFRYENRGWTVGLPYMA
jgi:hypothetical protein